MTASSATQQFQEAKSMFRGKRYHEALAVLEQLNQRYPGQKNILHPMALCMEQLGRVNEARELCVLLSRSHNHKEARQMLLRLVEPEVDEATLAARILRISPHSFNAVAATPPESGNGHQSSPHAWRVGMQLCLTAFSILAIAYFAEFTLIEMIILLWFETVFIGFFRFFEILVNGGCPPEAVFIKLACFFCVHYGAFMVAFYLIIVEFFGIAVLSIIVEMGEQIGAGSFSEAGAFTMCIIVTFVNCFVTFVRRLPALRARAVDTGTLIFSPYLRYIAFAPLLPLLMLIGIILPFLAILTFLTVKAIVDFLTSKLETRF